MQKEAATLAKQGKQVAVVAQHNERTVLPAGVQVLPVPAVSESRWERIRALPRAFRIARTWKADVYHAHEVESLLVGILLKWVTGAKLIFDSHECFHYTAARFQSGWRAKVTTAIARRVMGILARRADHVIVVSYSNEMFYRDECRCRNVTIIHNSPLPEDFPALAKSQEAKHTIVHNNWLSANRGIHEILTALVIVKQTARARFINVGMIKDTDREMFYSEVLERGLQDDVEVTGWLDYLEIARELNRGAIGLVAVQPTPNNQHTLHNKLFSYMSSGLAVIGPVGSDTEVVLDRSECGIAVDMTDPAALAIVMLKLLTDTDYAARLGANGRAAIENEYGWHHMETKLALIYEELFTGAQA